MITRFFKKGTKKTEGKKKMSSKPAPEGKKKTTAFQKVLTAEGWKRLMMRKYGKGKKK
ncbi:MAG: hypothetical protein JSR39_03310 [Verrucomicrobia bacterium]|nr:hypothetical protein [Verrucomicrobiota bacterium]